MFSHLCLIPHASAYKASILLLPPYLVHFSGHSYYVQRRRSFYSTVLQQRHILFQCSGGGGRSSSLGGGGGGIDSQDYNSARSERERRSKAKNGADMVI